MRDVPMRVGTFSVLDLRIMLVAMPFCDVVANCGDSDCAVSVCCVGVPIGTASAMAWPYFAFFSAFVFFGVRL